MSQSLLLPGEPIPQDLLPINSSSSKSLTLGPGVRFLPPSVISASKSGTVSTDNRKRSIWIEDNGGGRYIPAVGDQVIATVHHSSMDMYHCSVVPYAPHANLGHMAFEGVTRKTRPVLQTGSLVYARVSSAERYLEPELECVRPATGKADGLGELKGGMLFDISLGFARRLLLSRPREDGQISILEDLGKRGLSFEVAVGRNSKIWINSGSIKTTIAIGRLLQDVDKGSLTLEEQEQMVKKFIRSNS